MTAPKHNLDYNRADPLVIPPRRSIGLTILFFIIGACIGFAIFGLAVGILRLPPAPLYKALLFFFPVACGVGLAIIGGRTQPRELPEPEPPIKGELIGTKMMECNICSRVTEHTIYRTGESKQESECQTCGCQRSWRRRGQTPPPEGSP